MSGPLFSTREDAAQFAEYAGAFGNVDELLTSLEDNGISIGVDRRLRLMWLLASVAKTGSTPDRDMLKALLVPALAKTGDEQVEIGDLVDQWFTKNDRAAGLSRFVPDPNKRDPDSAQTVFGLDRWWIRLALGVVAVAVVAVVAMLLYENFGVGGDPNQVTPPIVLPAGTTTDAASTALLENILSRLMFGGVVLAAGFALFMLRTQAKARLTRRIGETDLVEAFRLYAPMPLWFRSRTARRFFDQLKRSRWFEINQIDARKSIGATVRAGGIPKIVRMLVRERPQYVLFVDRGGDWDHSDLLAKALESAISAADIVCTRYDFVDRPTRLSQVRNGVRELELLPLSVIGSRHAGERLIIVGRGSAFFERPGRRRDRSGRQIVVRSGTLAAELLHLREFSATFMLTPTPREMWGQTERHLAESGLVLSTADVAGVADIAAWLTREPETFGKVDAAIVTHTADTFVDRLWRDAVALSSDIPPALGEIEQLVAELRAWVGDEELFKLIVAIGVFQKVDPAFTQVLARLMLPSRDGVLDLPTFSKLLQLPWLRDGRFPEWLRIALANALDSNELKAVQRVQLFILDHLDGANSGQPAAGPSLDDLVVSFEVARALTDEQVQQLASRVDGGGLLDAEERVFVAVLKGHALHPVDDVLQPEAPAAMREKMEAPERQRQRRLVISIFAAALIAAGVQPWITGMFSSLLALLQPLGTNLQANILDRIPHWIEHVTRISAVTSTAMAAVTWIWGSFRTDAKPPRVAAALAIFGFQCALVSFPFAGFSGENARLSEAWLPLMSGAGVLFWILRVSYASWWRTPNLDDVWLERLRRDDWIASSLGAGLIGGVFLIPIALIVIPELSAEQARPVKLLLAASVGGLGWSAANALLRRFLLKNASTLLPGRPWLDFTYGTLVFLVTAALARFPNSLDEIWPTLLDFAPELITPKAVIIPSLVFVPIAWWVSARAVLGLRTPASVFARSLGGFAVITAGYVPLALFVLETPGGKILTQLLNPWARFVRTFMGAGVDDDFALAMTLSAINVEILLLYLIYATMRQSLANDRGLFVKLSNAFRQTLERPFAFQLSIFLPVVPILWIALIAAARRSTLGISLFSFLITDSPPIRIDAIVFLIWLLLMPLILAFWPILRFFTLPESERAQAGTPALIPWLGAVVIAALGFTWTTGHEVVSFAPLALPIAIFLAWRWGERAIIPIVTGSLPFVLSIGGTGVGPLPTAGGVGPDATVATAGGIWPLLAILFWCRFVRDAELRERLLRREHLGWTEVALIMLPLSCATGLVVGKIVGLDAVLSFDPDWMIATVGLIVGASRMPKTRLLVGLAAAGALYQVFDRLIADTASGSHAAAATHLGLSPSQILLALMALYILPAYQSLRPSISISDLKKTLLRQNSSAELSGQLTIHYRSQMRQLFDPPPLIFGCLLGLISCIWVRQIGRDLMFPFDLRIEASALPLVNGGSTISNATFLLAWSLAVVSAKKYPLAPLVLVTTLAGYGAVIVASVLFPQILPIIANADAASTDNLPAVVICAAAYYWFGKSLPDAMKTGPQHFSWRSVLAVPTAILDILSLRSTVERVASIGGRDATVSGESARLDSEQPTSRRESK